MKMEEELLTAGLKAVKEAYGDQIKELFGQEVIVPDDSVPRGQAGRPVQGPGRRVRLHRR